MVQCGRLRAPAWKKRTPKKRGWDRNGLPYPYPEQKSRQRLRSGVSHVGRLVSVRHEKKKITAYPPKSNS
ncbi:Uncharacterized protein APZ42_007980 [Daphnia magna]|uniref:Uncharacterized protein n=1 Tax=Daphnia magna TaxID=35525 RepID=A0A164EYD4_9CRUS|nr:Uncharacterized protein APZ42_007980 [Daphnia magna]